MKDHTQSTFLFWAAAPALMVLSACGEKPSNDPADPPEAEPTASIFGPKAELPAPAEQAELAAALPLKLTIGFPDGGDRLDADALAALEAALPEIKASKPASITLGAHNDAGGDDAANLTASQERGLAVARWLIENGVDEDRISVIAFGEQNPLQPNASPDGTPNALGRGANRRVELEITAVVPAQSQPEQAPEETAAEPE